MLSQRRRIERIPLRPAIHAAACSIREDSMTRIVLGGALAALMLGAIAAPAQTPAQTPSWVPPADSERCPSKWGAGDERGAANHMKPATVLNAAKLIKTGEVIELAHELRSSMPFFGT